MHRKVSSSVTLNISFKVFEYMEATCAVSSWYFLWHKYSEYFKWCLEIQDLWYLCLQPKRISVVKAYILGFSTTSAKEKLCFGNSQPWFFCPNECWQNHIKSLYLSLEEVCIFPGIAHIDHRWEIVTLDLYTWILSKHKNELQFADHLLDNSFKHVDAFL